MNSKSDAHIRCVWRLWHRIGRTNGVHAGRTRQYKHFSTHYLCICTLCNRSPHRSQGVWQVAVVGMNQWDNAFLVHFPSSEETPSVSMEHLSAFATVSGKESFLGTTSEPCLNEGQYLFHECHHGLQRSNNKAWCVIQQYSVSSERRTWGNLVFHRHASFELSCFHSNLCEED